MQFYTDQGNGEHRVYWGENKIQTGGTEGTASLIRAGPLPLANTWVRLRIPAEQVGLAGKEVKGVLYASHGGVAHWDKTTTSKSSRDPGGLGFSVPPIISSDDTTSTNLTYTLDQPAAVVIDVLDEQNNVVRHLKNGNVGEPDCCTDGDHSITWDQKSDVNADVLEGEYAFHVHTATGMFDTEVYSPDPSFNPATDTFPAPDQTSVTNPNGNVFRVDDHRVIKENPAGLFIAEIAASTHSLLGISLDSHGDLFVKQDDARVLKWQAGRVPFEIKNINASLRVPWPKAMVKATVPIIGAASARNFEDYTVDVRKGWTENGDWTVLAQSNQEVIDNYVVPAGQETLYGNLATWETGLTPGEEYPEQDIFHPATTGVAEGRWTVRLTVNNTRGSSAAVSVPVIVGRVVNNATGGLIRSDDGHVRVTVPPLALNQDWSVFSILSTSTSSLSADMPMAPAGLHFASALYEMMPPGSTFRRPLRMEMDVKEPPASLYWYDPAAKRWVFKSNQTVSISTNAVVLDEQLAELPDGRAFFALFAPDNRPTPPVLYQVASPREDRFAAFHGKGLPGASLALFSLELSTAFLPVETRVDEDGRFTFPSIYLEPGTHQLAAVQSFPGESISSGLLSDPSNTVSVTVSTHAVLNVTSLQFFNVNFLSPKNNNLTAGSTVLLELTGSDPDPSRVNPAYVLLRSTVTDPTGIVVRLMETGVATGRYRGAAALGDGSSQNNMWLGAVKEGEIIEAVSLDNPLVSAILYLENNIPPRAPVITSLSHPSAFQQTFETGLEGWETYDQLSGADVSLSTNAATGLHSIRLTQTKADGNFSALMFGKPVNVRQTPILSFDVRMDKTVRFNLFFRHNNGWLEYILNDAGERPKNFPPAFQTLGSHVPNQRGPALARDGQWQHVEINLFNSFRQRFPAAATDADFTVDSILLGDWDARELFGMASGATPINSWVEFDNVILASAGSRDQHPEFNWTTYQCR
jgi:hypothetical protein